MAAPAGIKYDEKMGSKMADMLQETDLLKLFNVFNGCYIMGEIVKRRNWQLRY